MDRHIFLLFYPDKIVRLKVSDIGQQMERAIELWGLPSSIECREDFDLIELPEDEVGT